MTVQTLATYDPPAAYEPDGSLARWVGITQAAAMLADRISDTDFVPDAMRGNAAMVTAAIMYGDELGVGPMQALAGINVIKGKPSPSSELMRALVYRAGHELRVLKSDGTTCRVAGKRKGDREPTVIEWSYDMARAAGLVDSNPTWRRYPRAMLLARATTELCRVMFPDVVKGLSHVVDDDTTAEGFDAWAVAETGKRARPATAKTQTVTRKKARERGVTDTPLPDDGPTYQEPTPEPLDEPERHDEWPDGVSQPALPLDTPAPDGIPSPTTATPAAVGPSGVPEPMPDVDDTEMMREDEPQGRRTLAIMHKLMGDLGIGPDERPKRLAILSTIVKRPISTSKELTRREALSAVRVLNDAAVQLVDIEPDPRQPYGIAITQREDDTNHDDTP